MFKRTLELQHKTEDHVRSNQDLETFARTASHDLQEPIRTVSRFVQLLAERYGGKLDAEGDKYIRLVTDGSRRMNTVITDLLQFSRIQGRGAPFNTVDLNQTLHDARANIDLTSF